MSCRRAAGLYLLQVALLVLMALTCPALGQGDRAADIAPYQGADREQQLIEGAKREGALTLYSNAPTDDNAALVGAFTRKHGIKVNLWRASSEEIRQRVLAEAKARRFDVDFILNNSPALEALRSEKILRPVQSPYLADLISPAVPPHREWIGFCLNVLVAAYNTNLVKRPELPASYQDLTDQRWKGRLGIEVDDFDWFAGLIEELGEANGLDTFRAIAATNGFSVRKGHTLLANLVAAGEVPLALTVFNYTAEQLKRKGAPVDWLALPPVVSMPNSIAVAGAAPHPHAAMLFLDFMLSEAQRLLAERDYVVTSTKVASPLDRRALKVLDSARILADGDKWRRLYTGVIASRK
jgi:iron(III) transport system substrate-binding protein